MKKIIYFKFIVSLFLGSIPSLANSQNPLPDYLQKSYPGCALVWDAERVIQSEVICRPGSEILFESMGGIATITRKSERGAVSLQREVKHVDSVPQPITDFIVWIQSCSQTDLCRWHKDAYSLLGKIDQINLSNGAWRFNLSVSDRLPDRGSATYFFKTGDDLLAVRNSALNSDPLNSRKIFPFFLVSE